MALVGFVLGLCWFVLCRGIEPLHPHHIDWLRAGDWAWHHLGWSFYRRDEWQWPPGMLGNYPDPVGSAIGYSDAIPWAALALKALAQVLRVRDDFQYLGPWLALCFGMQGVAGALVTATVTRRPLLQILGSALFVVAPILLFRIGHVALCGQWLILLMLWLNLRPASARSALLGALIVVFAAGVHPYLVVMLLALDLALLLRLVHARALAWPRALATAAATLACVGLAFAFLGYLDGTSKGTTGFGLYASDLLTLINPAGLSRLLPGWPLGPGQYEGIGYLGLGVLALGVVAVALRPRIPRQLLPLIAACLLLALYALSSHLRIAGHTIVDRPLSLRGFTRVFQSSGRFIWPLHYLLLAGAIVVVVRRLEARPRLAGTLLLAALALQVAECASLGHTLGPGGMRVPADPAWHALRAQHRRLVLYPAWLDDSGTTFTREDVIRLGWLAARLDMTINFAALSRANLERLLPYRAALERAVASRQLDEGAVYVVHPSARSAFAGRPGRTVDGYLVYTAR